MHLFLGSLLIAALSGLSACAEPSMDDEIIGTPCEVQQGCEYGYRCDPVWEDGVVTGGVCLYDQGHECNPGYSLCARGLGCLDAPLKEGVEEESRALCLPAGCFFDRDCPSGTICRNAQCVLGGCSR